MKTSYQYVLDLRDRLEETCKVAQEDSGQESARVDGVLSGVCSKYVRGLHKLEKGRGIPLTEMDRKLRAAGV